ncbi:MAG: hypothetical protein KGH62_05435, partial [Candidatus Micrarchaeota archaeon]|nr:hypothetical protein [Candidatus Micrarchaeota archaeon]
QPSKMVPLCEECEQRSMQKVRPESMLIAKIRRLRKDPHMTNVLITNKVGISMSRLWQIINSANIPRRIRGGRR